MIRLVSLLLLVKNFFRLGVLIFNIFTNIIDLGKHILRRRFRNFHFSLRWNYAIRKVFGRKTILYHIIFLLISAGSLILLSHMNSDVLFDIKYFYYCIGTYTFVYYFLLSFMMNWYQITTQQRVDENAANRAEERSSFRDRLRRLHPDDKIVNSVEDLYDV